MNFDKRIENIFHIYFLQQLSRKRLNLLLISLKIIDDIFDRSRKKPTATSVRFDCAVGTERPAELFANEKHQSVSERAWVLVFEAAPQTLQWKRNEEQRDCPNTLETATTSQSTFVRGKFSSFGFQFICGQLSE